MVTVRIFGTLRDKLGCSRVTVDATTVREALERVAGSAVDKKLLRSCVLFVNNLPLRSINRLATGLCDGDEIAILPPVSGG